MSMTRGELLGRPRSKEPVPVDGYNKPFNILRLTLAEMAQVRKAAKKYEAEKNDDTIFMKILLAYALVENNGNRLFPSPKGDNQGDNQDECDYLAGEEVAAILDASEINSLVKEVSRVNKLGKKDDKGVEQAAKN